MMTFELWKQRYRSYGHNEKTICNYIELIYKTYGDSIKIIFMIYIYIYIYTCPYIEGM